MTPLLDINVLIAWAWPNHEHHALARAWLKSQKKFATCPITQLGFLRLSANQGLGYSGTVADAWSVLVRLASDPRHEFWADSLEPSHLSTLRALSGPAHFTDGYLTALAAANHGTVATLDVQLSKSDPTHVSLIQ